MHSLPLWQRMQLLDENIKVAIIGAGTIGKGLFYQCRITPGIECVAIADVRIERGINCAELLPGEYRIVQDMETMHDTIRGGYLAVSEDGDLLARCEMADLLIEASSSIAAAGQFSVTAIRHGKHLILMNAEADLIFGPYLMALAQENGVVYSSCDGDQHGVIKHLVDELVLWGFHLVMAGNIKGFLDRYSTPSKIIPEADKRNLDYIQATAMTDGTKLNIEMALVANALDLTVIVPGMRGPLAARVHDVFDLFDFDQIWRSGCPVVDYILGAEPGGGVFAIGYCDNEYQRSMLSYYKMGDGPFYLFYRPYHLCHIEAIGGVAEAVLNGRPVLQPRHGFQTNVYTYAKRPIRKNERLDGLGGYTCYGLIEDCGRAVDPGLPVCLAGDVKVGRDIARDERISMTDIVCPTDRDDFVLYSKALETIDNERGKSR